MDREEMTRFANEMLEWHGKPEEGKWSGFSGVLATYDNASEKEAVEQLFKQIAKDKPPATINGVRFVLKSVKLTEETPTKGRIEAEYVKAEE